jgi:hypothetical protein
MLIVGPVTREAAAARFPFLAAKVSARRNQIKELPCGRGDCVDIAPFMLTVAGIFRR